MERKNIVFLTGAGVSVDSGLATFRGKNGLWTNEEWAKLSTTDALKNDTQKCFDFYNARRKQLLEVSPNDAHKMIADLETRHNVTIITQNVDNLHERAGSTNVVHIHGELTKVCSSTDRTTCIKEYPLDTPIQIGDKADDGSQLRPYIVMFGENVDNLHIAKEAVMAADVFIIIGTSLMVFPANNLLAYTKKTIRKYYIDPGRIMFQLPGLVQYKMTAVEGMKKLIEEL